MPMSTRCALAPLAAKHCCCRRTPPAGTERCEEAVSQLRGRYDIVVNIQVGGRAGCLAGRPAGWGGLWSEGWMGRMDGWCRPRRVFKSQPCPNVASSHVCGHMQNAAAHLHTPTPAPARTHSRMHALTPLPPTLPHPPQGDEPLIDPECIDAVVRALQDSPEAVYRCVCGIGGGGGGWGRLHF